MIRYQTVMKIRNAVPLLLLLTLLCVQRNDEMGARNNPFDPGGDNWTRSIPPEITVSVDSIWKNFNHAEETGTIGFSIELSDKNFPNDTLSVLLNVAGKNISLSGLTTAGDTQITVAGLKKASVYPCTVIVNDLMGESDTAALSVSTLARIPPLPPVPVTMVVPPGIAVLWETVAGVQRYILFSSSDNTGPYIPVDTVDAVPDAPNAMVVDTPSGGCLAYYLLAVENDAGTAFSDDTLTDRVFNNALQIPAIDASKGDYENWIEVRISIRDTSTCHHIELYRNVPASGDYVEIASLPPRGIGNEAYSVLYYCDTVSTGETLHYRAAFIDTNGCIGPTGSIASGFLKRIAAPAGIEVLRSWEALHVNWQPSVGAVYYNVYRSTGTSGNMQFLDSTTSLTYIDTTPTSEYYYYAVSAVDTSGRESPKSSYAGGRIGLLPPPENFVASIGTYFDLIKLTWDRVEGATGYVIHRDPSPDTKYSNETRDTVGNSTSFNDTASPKTYFIYWITALNNRGEGLPSGMKLGEVGTFPPFSLQSDNGDVVLTFTKYFLSNYFYIYRGTDSTSLVLIDSTNQPTYRDHPPDFTTYYYRLTLKTFYGESAPGNYGRVKPVLPQPAMFGAIAHDAGVLLSWQRVPYANGYRVYRSPSLPVATAYRDCTDTCFLDSLNDNERYYYTVAALHDTFVSAPSGPVTGGSTSAPLTPSGIKISGNYYCIGITWSLSPQSPTPAGYYIYRSNAPDFLELYDSTTSLLYNDSVADTLRYYYQISAYNIHGESPLSQAYSAARILTPSLTIFSASKGTFSEYIRIDWTPRTDMTRYGIYRKTVWQVDSLYHRIGIVDNERVFYDTACEVNRTYYYTVVGLPTNNFPGYGNRHDTGIRLGPPELDTITLVSSGIRISWNEPSYTVAGYTIYRSETSGGPFAQYASTTLLYYIDTAPVDGYNYYKVASKNSQESDLSPAALSIHSLRIPAAPPVIIASTGTEADYISVQWSTVNDALSYHLYRAPDDSIIQDTVFVISISDTCWHDTVGSDSMYFYRVQSINEFGGSELSTAAVGFRGQSLPPEAPSAPFISSDVDSIVIGWKSPSRAIGYEGYNVYRAPASDGPFVLQHTTGENFIVDIPPGSYPTVYWYRIVAYNQIGESPATTIQASRH
ncbi:MAG: hypothetical protein JW863_02675 [Chitinispirillaceae bacterium]|nr:hypothetical protein [Chitinispirillaceae bacterium]